MQSLPMTTTDAENGQIVCLVNRKLYGIIDDRQPEDTLYLLNDKAKSLGAKSIKGVSLVPMVNQDGVPIMMAYGTIYF